MLKRKLGIGTVSLLLSIIGIVWAFTLKGVCLGDNILNSLGLKAWSSGIISTHFTVYYSLFFFVPAFIIAIKYSNDFGARVGKVISLVVGIIIVLSTFGLAL